MYVSNIRRQTRFSPRVTAVFCDRKKECPEFAQDSYSFYGELPGDGHYPFMLLGGGLGGIPADECSPSCVQTVYAEACGSDGFNMGAGNGSIFDSGTIRGVNQLLFESSDIISGRNELPFDSLPTDYTFSCKSPVNSCLDKSLFILYLSCDVTAKIQITINCT